MKAECGVVYSEGMSHVDQGPLYEEQFKNEDLESIRYSVKDYKNKHQD